MTSPRPISFTPNLNRAWKRTFWTIYDHLGLLFILTLIWLLSSLTIVLIPVATASLFHIAYLLIQDKPASIKLLPQLFIKYFIKSTLLFLLLALIFVLLIFNLRFYLSHFGLIGIILASLCFWLMVFFLMTLNYTLPLLCRNYKIKKIIFYSFILVLNNFKVSLMLSIYLVIFFFFGIMLPIIGIALLAVFNQNVFLELASLYNPQIKITTPYRQLGELLKPWEFIKR